MSVCTHTTFSTLFSFFCIHALLADVRLLKLVHQFLFNGSNIFIPFTTHLLYFFLRIYQLTQVCLHCTRFTTTYYYLHAFHTSSVGKGISQKMLKDQVKVLYTNVIHLIMVYLVEKCFPLKVAELFCEKHSQPCIQL